MQWRSRHVSRMLEFIQNAVRSKHGVAQSVHLKSRMTKQGVLSRVWREEAAMLALPDRTLSSLKAFCKPFAAWSSANAFLHHLCSF